MSVHQLLYEEETFYQEWILYMDAIRPIIYFLEGKPIIKKDQLEHILEIMINIQKNKIGEIENNFTVGSILNEYHFYINLEKRSEKKVNCEEQLRKIGINKPNRFCGIENV